MQAKFDLIMRFLRDNPDRFSSRSKSLNLDTQEGINNVFNAFCSPRVSPVVLRMPTTIPDVAVSNILGVVEGYSKDELAYIQKVHSLSMAAENKIGELLERYLAEKLEPFGWVWCSGNFVRAIDFIKWDENTGWRTLQIKNRSNTENSSSITVRNGTAIEKWFRTYANPSKSRVSNTNWDNFPDENLREILNEEDFLSFVAANISA
ncbi:hypothetical protein A1D22_10925 [Pasteurellaceae bacterium LFhippo2]|nr:hypothetical protein [Pasteurellaceae bacterium LFhippo2]